MQNILVGAVENVEETEADVVDELVGEFVPSTVGLIYPLAAPRSARLDECARPRLSAHHVRELVAGTDLLRPHSYA